MNDTKMCNACGKELPITEFYPKKLSGRIYYTGQCKECIAEATRTRNKNRPKKVKESKKKVSNSKQINQINAKAMEKGISYGKYVAMQYMHSESL